MIFFNPLAQESREKMRRLKQEKMDQELCLSRSENNCDHEIKTKESKYSSDVEMFSPCASIPCLS